MIVNWDSKVWGWLKLIAAYSRHQEILKDGQLSIASCGWNKSELKYCTSNTVSATITTITAACGVSDGTSVPNSATDVIDATVFAQATNWQTRCPLVFVTSFSFLFYLQSANVFFNLFWHPQCPFTASHCCLSVHCYFTVSTVWVCIGLYGSVWVYGLGDCAYVVCWPLQWQFSL